MQFCDQKFSHFSFLSHYAPNFEEVDGAYWFQVVRSCIRLKHACHILWTMHVRVLKFHIPHGKIAELFFFWTELSPFLELCPSEKIRMKSDACHILWTVHARVLKFHIWIPHGKIADHIFLLVQLSSFLELCPFEIIRMKSVACHILWTMHAWVLKFHIWIPHGKIADHIFFSCLSYLPFWSYAPLKKSEWNLVSKISRKYLSWGLESWSADRGW